jgi:hypothetical protein
MTQLEPRTLMSTTVKIIHVGPKQAIKTMAAVPWPKSGSTASIKVLVDYSSTPYYLAKTGIFGNVTIEPADPSHRPTFKLEPTNYPTLYANGRLTVRNINTVGGYKIILCGSTKNSYVTAENIKMLDGGCVWRGQGIISGVFKNNEVYGVPYDNVYGNFTNRAQKVIIDHSGTKVPVRQGTKETAIRIMNVDNLTLKGITTKPYIKDGRIFKQDVQLRPSSKLINVINCHFGIVDIGDMTWRKPALPIEKVVFTNCTLDKGVHITSGVKQVQFINTKVGGSTWNKTIYP